MATAREDLLAGFVALLKSEGRHSVLGVNCGRGTEGLLFVRAGIRFTGVDGSEEDIHAARARGLDASVASGSALPFADSAFPAVWAPDSLPGLPPEDRDKVIHELWRVAESGAPIAIVLPGPVEGFAVLRSPG